MKKTNRSDFRFLTVEEVSEIMRVKPRTVRKWILEKKIPATKEWGQKWLISTLDVPSYKRINNSGDKQ